jgi:hypothetical protein
LIKSTIRAEGLYKNYKNKKAMNLKKLSLVFAITGTFILYVLSLLSKPALIEIRQIEDYEGKKVIMNGKVTNFYTTKYASQMITIIDQNNSVDVYVEGITAVEYGDKIQVVGEVQKYKEEYEIIVDDKRNLKIIEKWDNATYPIWQLAEKPENYLNSNVKVLGYVDSIFEDYFIIKDVESGHKLMISYSSIFGMSLYPGKKVIISGRFLFENKNLRYKLVLCEEQHSISLISEEENV